MKIVVVGGGSTYTPELIDGFARLRETLPLTEIVLVDPHQGRRQLLAGVARRMLAKQGHPAVVTETDDVAAAAEGAIAVLLQLRVGGQQTRHRDESWPLECGCLGQETTGAGGLAKAVRTVPVVLDIADKVRAVNPDAWIIDFTNPVGIVTRALLSHGHKAIGLCNVAIGLQRYFSGLLGVPPERIALDHLGLNHLTWERGVRLLEVGESATPTMASPRPGTDLLPSLLVDSGEALAARMRQPVELLRRLEAIPSYYLRYFYQHDAVVEEQLGSPTRAEQVAEMEATLLELYADPAVDEKPALLSNRGGEFYSEAAVHLVASLVSDRGDVQVVNTLNRGTIPFLPDDFVIETPAVITAGGAQPLPQAPVEPRFAGLIAHVAAYEQLALDAAVHGGRDRITDALLAHPLVGQWDLAEKLSDRLIAENAAFLPWAR
ncbi:MULTISPECIES: 6-phospho-beta-glucosidase [unclassified Microbacterium]|uniref:6-phospho-beta-glucosidase n=1 Tax=unclassified Microbacterium TaxID=2609290 RepID=UPI000EA8C6BF|nr:MULTISPECIES: 6-phospho-beta-glucosidase [unclassified Microbacterium]MBT2485115.1 6-phospho-beta-glucosidase [Microbacterium sp. ISL-108]RKN67956.1 6-phospho-beta-glucosidase [Microbacterium sp. CGR2]